jgi:hypothetical protein
MIFTEAGAAAGALTVSLLRCAHSRAHGGRVGDFL